MNIPREMVLDCSTQLPTFDTHTGYVVKFIFLFCVRVYITILFSSTVSLQSVYRTLLTVKN